MAGKPFENPILKDLPDFGQTVDLRHEQEPNPLGYFTTPIKPSAPPMRTFSPSKRPFRVQSPLLDWLHQNSFTLFFMFMLTFMTLQWLIPTPTFFLQGQLVVILLSSTLLIQAHRFKDKKLMMTCALTMALAMGLNCIVLAENFLDELVFKQVLGANLLALSVLLAVLILVLVYHLWHNDYTGRNALFCACSSYLLIGFLWSCFYCSVSYFVEGAFANSNDPPGKEGAAPIMDYSKYLYFSMITITTVGFGDIAPISPIARSLCWIEAGIGQFYFGFILARLVSTQFMNNQPEHGWQHDPATNAFKTPLPPNKLKAA